MKKLLFPILFFISMLGSAQIAISKIYTDFGGFFESGSSVLPDNSNNLLGFTWNNITYSTGVDDAKLSSKSIIFQANIFKALPSSFKQKVNSANTFIGVGFNYGGVGNVQPVPVQNNLANYLIDGQQGLDFGTGIFNFPKSGEIYFEITSINPNSIGDNIPDIVITQIGEPSDAPDEYFFVDKDNNVVGNKYSVVFSLVPSLGSAKWKFYNSNVNPPTYNSSLSASPNRNFRLLAFDWSELGLSITNISQVVKLVQVFSGTSDTAFTAYNIKSVSLKTTINGTVFNDNNAGVPDGNAYPNATLTLINSGGSLVATTSTDINGNYTFSNVSSGQYTINLSTPSGFVIVGNTAGNSSNIINVTVTDNPVNNKNFAINQPPVATNDNLITLFNEIISVNILSNDNDPNSGTLVASSINLIPPSSATNIIYRNGFVKEFTITGQGKWSVDDNGLFTFSPVLNFSGNATPVKYVVKDNANLTSNQAIISIKVEEFCYKPAAKNGTTLDTNHGISALGNSDINNDNWPMLRKGAWTVLEAKTKGFVINRISSTSQIDNLPNPVEGMMVYDAEAKCLKIYTTTDNGATFSWKCVTKQTCPQN